MKSLNLTSVFSFICIIIASWTLLSGCEEKGIESPILVFLNPTDPLIESNSGDRVFITVKSSTSQGNSLNLRIESQDDYYGIRALNDTLFSNNSINYRFEYLVPSYPDSTQSILIFTLNNEAGEYVEIAKRILVNKGDTFLEEASGINMYSTASSKPNAFSLATLSPGFSTDSSTFVADIVDGTKTDSTQLSRIWTSNTGLSFVQFDGFDYANATASSIRTAYQNGIQLSKISEITDNDIYLVGKGSNAIGVIQIIAVTDPEGAQEDKYNFSVKAVSQQ